MLDGGTEEIMLKARIGLRDFAVEMNRALSAEGPHVRCDTERAMVEVAPDATFEDLLNALTQAHSRAYSVPPRVPVVEASE